MKKYIFLTVTAMMILFSSCSSREPQMDRTVFVPDEADASLPAYTEWGYNSFGAMYDIKHYFVVSNNIVPCKILHKDGRLRFTLNGVLKGIYYYESENVTLSFNFPYEKPTAYTDLLTLNDTNIDLTSNDCVVTFIRGETERTLNIVEGFLFFKRAQLLYIDDVPNRIILSGTFELSFLENDFPTTISDGRFDLGITKNLFYAY